LVTMTKNSTMPASCHLTMLTPLLSHPSPLTMSFDFP
jgi:hypothetical protein